MRDEWEGGIGLEYVPALGQYECSEIECGEEEVQKEVKSRTRWWWWWWGSRE